MLCRDFLYLYECPNLSLKSISLVNTRFIHSLHTTVSKVCKYQIGFGCLFRFLKVAYIYDSFWFKTLTLVPFQNWKLLNLLFSLSSFWISLFVKALFEMNVNIRELKQRFVTWQLTLTELFDGTSKLELTSESVLTL